MRCTGLPMNYRRTGPRERGRLARNLIRAGRLRSEATSSYSAPIRPLEGSLPWCQIVCGRDARAPGWVPPPASLFLQAGCGPGPFLRTVHQFGHWRDRFYRARSNAGETPALPGGCLRPQAYSSKQAAVRGDFFAQCTNSAIGGIVSMVPGRMRARRPRSRVVFLRAGRPRSRVGHYSFPLADLWRIRFDPPPTPWWPLGRSSWPFVDNSFYPCSSATISRAACLALSGWSGGKEMAATTGCPPPP